MSNAFQFSAPVGDQAVSRDPERIMTKPLFHEVQANPFQPPEGMTPAQMNQKLLDERLLPPLSLYVPDVPPRFLYAPIDTANPISRDRNAITTDDATPQQSDASNPISRDRNAITPDTSTPQQQQELDKANPIPKDRNAITPDPDAEQRRLNTANPISKDRNAIQ